MMIGDPIYMVLVLMDRDLIDEEKGYLDDLKNMEAGEITHLADKLDIIDTKENHKQFIKNAE